MTQLTEEGLDRLMADILAEPVTLGQAINKVVAGEWDSDDLRIANGGSFSERMIARILTAAKFAREARIW